MEDRQALEAIAKRADEMLAAANESIWTEGKDVPPLVVELVSNLNGLTNYVAGYLDARREAG